MTQIATDRSMRRIDADGHMHVEMTNISKANVCPYYGREIPNGAELRLDPNAVYMLYRDPAELKAAASTFAGKPLLMHHVPITADAPSRDLWVGCIGTTVDFSHPYLRAPISVWTSEAIGAIEKHPDDPESQGELSPGYRYTADMTPGRTPEGVAFHGRMRNIMANHLAIVHEGRTGPDVYVADEAPTGLSDMRFKTFFTALAAALPTLKAEQVVALDAALDAEFKPAAKDAFPDMSAEDKKAALDAFAKKSGKAMDALTDEEKTEAYKTAAKDAATGGPATGKPATGMDEATVTTRVAAAVTAALEGTVLKINADKLALDAATTARAEVHALYTARKDVEGTVGVVAMDSADAVYRFALDHLKVDHKGVALLTEVKALYVASAKAAVAPALATDAAPFDISSIYTFKG